jgi:hypothetical protein
MPKTPITFSPRYWRDRAEEMRRVAEMMTGLDAKQKMLGVVESYEKLARQAEHAPADETKTPGKS